jgi:hypothetical protein
VRRGMSDDRAERPQQFRTGRGELPKLSLDDRANPLAPRRCQRNQETTTIVRIALPRDKALADQIVDDFDDSVPVDVERVGKQPDRGGGELSSDGEEHAELRALQAGFTCSLVGGIDESLELGMKGVKCGITGHFFGHGRGRSKSAASYDI